MSRNAKETDVPGFTFKNESARQRWELFHRAIARAKQLNNEAMDETSSNSEDSGGGGSSLTIVR